VLRSMDSIVRLCECLRAERSAARTDWFHLEDVLTTAGKRPANRGPAMGGFVGLFFRYERGARQPTLVLF
jgi:hypothetical protein